MPIELKWQDFWWYAIAWAAVTLAAACVLAFYSISDAVYLQLDVGLFIAYASVLLYTAKRTPNGFYIVPSMVVAILICSVIAGTIPVTESATTVLLWVLTVGPLWMLGLGWVSRAMGYLSPNAEYYRGTALLERGRYEEARDVLNSYVGTGPADPDSLCYRAYANIGTWRIDEAIDDIERALSQNPARRWQLLALRGWCLAHLGDPDNGVAFLELAKQSGSHHVTLIALAEAYLLSGRYDDATKVVKSSSLARAYGEALLVRAEAERLAGRTDAGEEGYAGVVDKVKGIFYRRSAVFAHKKTLLAYGLAQLGRDRQAIVAASEAFELNERDVRAIHAVALCRAQQGNAGEMERLFERILEISPPAAARILGDPQFSHAHLSRLRRIAQTQRADTLADIHRRYPELREAALRRGLGPATV